MIPGLPICSLIVWKLNGSGQSGSQEFPPGLRGCLFVCQGHSAASHTLMGLPRCLGLIIPMVALEVTGPQVLFAGRKGSKVANSSSFYIQHTQEVERYGITDVPRQLNLNGKRDPSLRIQVLLPLDCLCHNETLFL